MRKRFLLGLLLATSFSMYAKDIKELVVTTNPPMSCRNCENKIKGNLRFEKGIKKIETDIPEQRVTIEYDADKTDASKIEAAFEKIGYHVQCINDKANHTPGTCSPGDKICPDSGEVPSCCD